MDHHQKPNDVVPTLSITIPREKQVSLEEPGDNQLMNGDTNQNHLEQDLNKERIENEGEFKVRKLPFNVVLFQGINSEIHEDTSKRSVSMRSEKHDQMLASGIGKECPSTSDSSVIVGVTTREKAGKGDANDFKEKEEELNGGENDFKAKEEELNGCENDFDEEEEEIKGDENVFKEKEEELKVVENGLDEKEEELKGEENAFKEKEEELKGEKNDFKEKEIVISLKDFWDDIPDEGIEERRARRLEGIIKSDRLRQQGNICCVRETYEEAVQYYTEAIELVEDSSTLYTDRAFVYIKSRKFNMAVQDCNKAILLAPYSLKARLFKAKALYKSGRYSHCISCLQEARNVLPRSRHTVDQCEKHLFQPTATSTKRGKHTVASELMRMEGQHSMEDEYVMDGQGQYGTECQLPVEGLCTIADQHMLQGQFTIDGQHVIEGQFTIDGQHIFEGQFTIDGPHLFDGQFTIGGQYMMNRQCMKDGQYITDTDRVYDVQMCDVQSLHDDQSVYDGQSIYDGQTAFYGQLMYDGQAAFYGQLMYDGQAEFDGQLMYVGQGAFEGQTAHDVQLMYDSQAAFDRETAYDAQFIQNERSTYDGQSMSVNDGQSMHYDMMDNQYVCSV